MPAKFPQPSAAVEAARSRRAGLTSARLERVEWFIDQVSNTVSMEMRTRVKIATELVRAAVVRNISRPVTKGVGPRGGYVVMDRSKPGEFPKAETTRLMKDIFGTVVERGGEYNGYIGTTLDYGLILETRMNRSFLVRTLREERSRVDRILTGPIK